MKLTDFDFVLPEESIAQSAAMPRDSAKLLHVGGSTFQDLYIRDIASLTRPNDVWVLNNSKVIPARLFGKRGEVKIEILLHKRNTPNVWEVFARPMKRLHVGDEIVFAENFTARVQAIKENGLAELEFAGDGAHVMTSILKYGVMPLPPYIKHDQHDAKVNAEDNERYQTVYAGPEGSVAAPTAGLHFTEQLLENIKQKGAHIAHVTLHVGAGTFQPVKTEDIAQHVMHSEYAELSQESADIINHAKQQGGRVIAVGTTSTRVLESIADAHGILKPWQGETAIFITPGYRFKIVDAMLTNFHLPKSTLFMLVSAFAGLERMKAAYAHAIAHQYRFYSYGDACFLEKSPHIDF